jgi:signal transduction histidine kinase
MSAARRWLLCHEAREWAEAAKAALLEACPSECLWVDSLQALENALTDGWAYDLAFAGMDPHGLEALKLAARLRPGLPFLGLQIRVDEAAAEEWLGQGAADCLSLEAPVLLAHGIRRALAEAGTRAEREEARAASARLASMLRGVLEATSEGLLILDLAGRVVLYNRQLMAQCGFSEGVLAPMQAEDVIQFLMDHFQDPSAFLNEALRRNPAQEKGLEGLLTSAGGQTLEARLLTSRVGVEPAGRVLRFRDPPAPAAGMASGPREEALLRATSQRLAEPVGKLRNRVDLLAASSPLTEAQHRHLGAAEAALERMEELVARLAGPAPGKVRELQLNALLEAMRPRAEILLPRGIQFRFEPGEGLPPLSADPVQVEQVFLALFTNARDAGPRTVTLRTGALERSASGERRVFLEVEDDGSSPESGDWEQMFQPFFTTRKDALGLGLWTARRILALHGGSLTAEAVVPRGARFRAAWPAMH